MPSAKAKRMLSTLRSHRALFQTVSGAVLTKINLPDQTAAGLKAFGTRGRLVKNAARPTMVVSPRRVAAPGAVLLHLHGGAYKTGGLLAARMVISPIVSASRIPAVTFAYRLAPEHPYPAQLEDALFTYRLLLRSGVSPEKIALVGESAGGNLAIALLLSLRARGEALPGALCLLSPWADLAQEGESYRSLAQVDPTLNVAELMSAALQFVGGAEEKLSDPLISPIYADFQGFPPTQIHVGESEILLSDSETLLRCMLRDGVPATLFRWEGMCHVFQIYGFPESRASIHAIGDFLLGALSGDRRARLKERRFL